MNTEGMSEEARRFWVRAGRLRDFALVALAYAVGLFPLWLVFGVIEGEGGPRDVWVPYFAVYGVLFGAVVSRWWLLAFPFLHMIVIEPLQARIEHGPEVAVSYAYDREAMTIAATVGILAGIVVHHLVLALLRQRNARSRQVG